MAGDPYVPQRATRLGRPLKATAKGANPNGVGSKMGDGYANASSKGAKARRAATPPQGSKTPPKGKQPAVKGRRMAGRSTESRSW